MLEEGSNDYFRTQDRQVFEKMREDGSQRQVEGLLLKEATLPPLSMCLPLEGQANGVVIVSVFLI